MNWILYFILGSQFLWGRTDHFVIKIYERSVIVESLDKVKDVFQVVIENKTLAPQIGKIMVGEKNMVFFNIPADRTHSLTIDNTQRKKVIYYPLSPSFQEVELIFQKKQYEIPPKK